jgi:hypothetical protein
MKKKTKIKKRNFVQMYVQEFNTPQIFDDRKAKMKRGYSKHKKRIYSVYEKKLNI